MSTETLDPPTPETSRQHQKKEDVIGSPFNRALASLENEDTAQAKGTPISHQVNETTSERSDTAIALRQPEKEDETAVQSSIEEISKIPRETASSVAMLTPPGDRHTQELGENQQDLTGFQHDRSNQKRQSGKFNEKSATRYRGANSNVTKQRRSQR